MSTGIELLLADHVRVNDLFTEFGATGDATLVGQILDALTAHDDAEQAALYPLAGHVLGDVALIERAAAAHSAVKATMERLRALEGAALVAEVETLRQLVTKHVADEEKNLFPRLQQAITPAQDQGLGARILQVKQRVG